MTTTAKQRPHINVRSHAVSLNYLIDRSEETGWHSNTERFGSLKIDDELEPGWLHHRHIGRFLALQDAAGVDADLTVSVLNARAIAYQTARDCGGARLVGYRDRKLSGECN